MAIWLYGGPTIMTLVSIGWLTDMERKSNNGDWKGVLIGSIMLSWFIWALWFVVFALTWILVGVLVNAFRPI
ncbi:hypothetical protein HY36_17595 [Hyphomonas atlantica]|uniref:Uncharacterized protein n=1 Tax=Hyphomonas atlantica TaxID=1280948 RepID=A0A059E053_9PROT|nr:hypothetical protein HY36_17595 [Hyphomonas atlantica]